MSGSKLKLPPITDGCLISANDFSNTSSSLEDIFRDRLSPPVQDDGLLPTAKGGRRGTFKALASVFVAQRSLVRETVQKWENELKEVSSEHEKDRTEDITFNVNGFKAHIQACPELSPEMKSMLRSFSKHRTPDEIKVAANLVRRMKVFESYTPMVKEELGKIIYFDDFEDGRLVTAQGQPIISFFFVVSGNVLVERIETDRHTGLRHIQKVCELGPGDTFGELSQILQNDKRRSASMICRGYSEFLRIDRGDFIEALKRCRDKESDIRATMLAEIEAFEGYTEKEMKSLNVNAKTESYPPNTIIIGETNLRPDRVFFVVSGSCHLVRELIVIRRQLSKKRYKYILPSDEFTTRAKNGDVKLDNPKDTIEQHYLIIHKLSKGDVFNTGECLDGMNYVTDRQVKVLHIARASLTGQKLEHINEYYARHVPNRQEAFNNFVGELRWKCFKKNMVKQILEDKRNRRNTKGRTVPISFQSMKSIYNDTSDIM